MKDHWRASMGRLASLTLFLGTGGRGPVGSLRRRRLPSPAPLNGWHRDQYLEVFAGYFEIVNHYCVTREGEKLLTPQLEAELSTYSRDELTCRSYIILARKAS